MIKLNVDYFCLGQICRSGQCFRMEEINQGEFCLTALGRQLRMRQRGTEVYFDCSSQEFEEIWRAYFDLEENYGQWIMSIDDNDCYLKSAAAYGKGIRILRQDLWETLISFIISQQNNIKRIRRCIQLLCEKYGESKQTKDQVCFYDFPSPKALANASVEELRKCNLGYRSRYIRETAEAVWEGRINLEQIRCMEYERAKETLMTCSGVGKKVAECVCLFALHHLDAFPVDTHINKALEQHYPMGFPADRYAGYSGVLQQYIFYYDLQKADSEKTEAEVDKAK